MGTNTIEEDPLEVRRRVRDALFGNDGAHAIAPLAGVRVGLAVQLPVGDGLGVEGVLLHALREGVRAAGAAEQREGLAHALAAGGLAGPGGPHQHDPVAHHEGLVQLRDLAIEGGHAL